MRFSEFKTIRIKNIYVYLYFFVRLLSRDITDGFHFEEQNSKAFFVLNIMSTMPFAIKNLSVSEVELEQFRAFFLMHFHENLCANLFHDIAFVRKNMEQTISKSVADDVDFLLNCSVNVSSY